VLPVIAIYTVVVYWVFRGKSHRAFIATTAIATSSFASINKVAAIARVR
jgi:hypothetical protein